MFRLLYRGERDAFIPNDNDEHDESGGININGSRPIHQPNSEHNTQQPPLLSVEPKLSNNIEKQQTRIKDSSKLVLIYEDLLRFQDYQSISSSQRFDKI